ncbi:hypothetical protein Ppha_2234 [Pelodictyon phaeoclathratiforme BU-1]|uniref:Uncharacterized protein n=1 Tax=Pelodictyon phaeoclathratiforme (strain DSM 5477 / BU-1) TaxID=324925 RepID=B4SDR3_PELPB|nr:hypothetical protein Ppha_2234 [Pelodictyon phaeoclathratiforme BU-1]
MTQCKEYFLIDTALHRESPATHADGIPRLAYPGLNLKQTELAALVTISVAAPRERRAPAQKKTRTTH